MELGYDKTNLYNDKTNLYNWLSMCPKTLANVFVTIIFPFMQHNFPKKVDCLFNLGQQLK